MQNKHQSKYAASVEHVMIYASCMRHICDAYGSDIGGIIRCNLVRSLMHTHKFINRTINVVNWALRSTCGSMGIVTEPRAVIRTIISPETFLQLMMLMRLSWASDNIEREFKYANDLVVYISEWRTNSLYSYVVHTERLNHLGWPMYPCQRCTCIPVTRPQIGVEITAARL